MRDLELVIPVYNEECCIADVLGAWQSVLDALQIDYEIIVMNDGSTDGTAKELAPFEGSDRVDVVTKSNSGHGPTILQGYRLACERAPWVFQCDGDDEMDPSHFNELWSIRQEHDAVFGERLNRHQSAGRRLISAVSRLTVRLGYASGVRDVNTPYRLMRSTVLAPIVSAIPDATFAPNLVISGVLALAHVRIANVPVPHHNRTTGSVSIVRWKLWAAAARSLVQTLMLAGQMRSVAKAISHQVGETGAAS